MKLPKNEIGFELKDELTRKEMKTYKQFIFKGATSTKDGGIDQASILENIENQQDELIKLFVKKFGEKNEITSQEIDDLINSDYEFLLKKCQEKFNEHEEKKS